MRRSQRRKAAPAHLGGFDLSGGVVNGETHAGGDDEEIVGGVVGLSQQEMCRVVTPGPRPGSQATLVRI